MNGGSGTTIINNPLSTFVAFLYKLVLGGSSITVGFIIWYAAATFAALMPFYCWAGLFFFGYAFILLGIALIIGALITPPISIFIRRKEYAYA